MRLRLNSPLSSRLRRVTLLIARTNSPSLPALPAGTRFYAEQVETRSKPRRSNSAGMGAGLLLDPLQLILRLAGHFLPLAARVADLGAWQQLAGDLRLLADDLGLGRF